MTLIIFLSIIIPGLFSLLFATEIFFYVIIGNIFNLLLLNYSLKSLKLNTKKNVKLLTVFLLIISFFAVFSYISSITGGSNKSPYIPGGDGESYYQTAIALSTGNPFENINFFSANYLGYQFILSYFFKFLGRNLFVGLLLNYTFLMATITQIVKTTTLITDNNRMAYYTIIAATLTTPIATYGILLLKDIVIIFSFSLFLYNLIKIFKVGFNMISIINIALSILMIGFLRLPFLIVLIFSIIFIATKLKYRFTVLILAIGFLFIIFPIFTQYSRINFEREYILSKTITNTTIEGRLEKSSSESGGVVNSLISGYTDRSMPYRIITLPIPLSIQFVTPFNFLSDKFITDHSWYFFREQLNILWFGLIGVFMLFGIFNYRKINNVLLKRSFTIGVLLYVGIAFVYGGAIPRYAVPSLVFMLPLISYYIYCYYNEKKTRQKIISFFKKYYTTGFVLFAFYIIFKLIN